MKRKGEMMMNNLDRILIFICFVTLFILSFICSVRFDEHIEKGHKTPQCEYLDKK